MEGMAGAEVVGRGNSLHVKHGDDKGLLARFYWNKTYEKEFIKINVPGDSKTEWDRPVKPEDKLRFANQWNQYISQQSQFGDQTPLEQWGSMTEAQINQYKAFNILTVEHLSVVQDGLITQLGMGARDLQKRARSWLEEQKAKRNEQVLHAEISKRDIVIDGLQQQMKELQEQVAAMAQTQPKQRGRKSQGESNDTP